MSGWNRFNDQFRKSDWERRARLRASYKRRLAEQSAAPLTDGPTAQGKDADVATGGHSPTEGTGT